MGRNQPPMYTETLPGESLALMIPSLSVEMGGIYYCTASYANTEILEKAVTITTYGKFCNSFRETTTPPGSTQYTVHSPLYIVYFCKLHSSFEMLMKMGLLTMIIIVIVTIIIINITSTSVVLLFSLCPRTFRAHNNKVQ